MSHEHDHREALRRYFHDLHALNHCPHWTGGALCEREADALLGSDVVARIKAEARAEALREAADELPHRGPTVIRGWLRARAALDGADQ